MTGVPLGDLRCTLVTCAGMPFGQLVGVATKQLTQIIAGWVEGQRRDDCRPGGPAGGVLHNGPGAEFARIKLPQVVIGDTRSGVLTFVMALFR
jgi:hypothetical protein